jgi:hypothetical protein
MNVGTGTETAQFLFWEYINWIFGTVYFLGLDIVIVSFCCSMCSAACGALDLEILAVYYF